MADVVTITVDHPQKRMRFPRLSAFASAKEFNPFAGGSTATLSGVDIEPVGGRLILKPYARESTWYTSNSGNYAKLGLSAFASTTGWTELADMHAKGPYLTRMDQTTGTLLTSASYAKNQGWYIAAFVASAGDVFVSHRFGWNSTASTASGVYIELASDGTVNVFKGGVAIGQGKISGAKTTSNTTNSLVEMIVLPIARREIVIYSPSDGNGFSVIVPGIDENTSSPEIIPATKFWIETVSAGTSQVQVAPLKFPTSGTATSDRMSFVDPPATGEGFESWEQVWPTGPNDYLVWGFPAYTGTQDATVELRKIDNTAFVANGALKDCRLRVTMTTDNTAVTPCVYGACQAYARILESTPDESVQIQTLVTECTLSVPEDPEGLSMSLTIRDPEGIAAPNMSTVTNRPFLAKIGTKSILDGMGGAVPREWTPNPAADTIKIEVLSRLKILAEHVFDAPMPLDGLTLTQAIKFFAGVAFAAADINVTTTTFALTFEGSQEAGDWGYLVQVNDNPLDWLRRVMDDFAPDWYWGVRPKASGVEFYALSPADLGTTPKATVYETWADALADGKTDSDRPYVMAREIVETLFEPLANDVTITGVDPRSGRPFQSRKEDTDSKDPTIDADLRPENWVGGLRRYGLADPAITTQTLCDEVCERQSDKLFRAMYGVEWNGGFLVGSTGIPLWRGDVVRIYNRGDFRIESLGGRFSYEYNDSLPVFREFIYTADKLP